MSVEFVDTNILVYAYDPTTPEKHEIAADLVRRLWESETGALSVQVLQELFWTVTRKVPRPIAPVEAVRLVEELSTWNVSTPDAGDVIAAARMSIARRLSFWDAMIVQTAIGAGAEILWSEDFAPGTRFETVTVRNPFAPGR